MVGAGCRICKSAGAAKAANARIVRMRMRMRKPGRLFTNTSAVCVCGPGRPASLPMLATASDIAALCASQLIPIRSAHFPLDP